MSVVLFGVFVAQVAGAALLLPVLRVLLSRWLRRPSGRWAGLPTGWVVEAIVGRYLPVRSAPAASRAPPGGRDDAGIGVPLRCPVVATVPVYTPVYRRRRPNADDSW